MDDLNHDGHVNFEDTRVILAAVERVEHQYPDLVGGVGSTTPTDTWPLRSHRRPWLKSEMDECGKSDAASLAIIKEVFGEESPLRSRKKSPRASAPPEVPRGQSTA